MTSKLRINSLKTLYFKKELQNLLFTKLNFQKKRFGNKLCKVQFEFDWVSIIKIQKPWPA